MAWERKARLRQRADVGSLAVAVYPPAVRRTPAAPQWGEESYRTVFENATIGIYMSSPEGRFLNANPAFARMLGYATPGELTRAVSDIAAQHYVDPERRRMFRQELERCGRVSGFVSLAKRREGTAFWVNETGRVVCDGAGRPLYYVGTAEDVTERVNAEAALREAERRHRELFDYLPIGIYRCTADGRWIHANAALVRLHGYEAEDEMLAAVNGVGDWYVDLRRRDEFKRRLEEEGRVERFVSEIFRHKTRERIWVSENARAVRDRDGSLRYYEGTVQDITAEMREEQLRRDKDAAEAMSRTKSQFLANMSHELRTPLNAIIGFAELMGAGVFGPLGNERYRGYANDIRQSAHHLLQLIDDILDLSRAEAGKLTVSDDLIDLGVEIDACVRMLSRRAEESLLGIEVRGTGLRGKLRADKRRVRQILLNLLTNAIKFTPDGGRIVVEVVRRRSGGITLAVEDTGIGMAPADIARAFEPFVQLHRMGHQEGTGLGLPLCQELMKLHDGRLVLTSTPGQGTRVEARFPKSRTLSAGRRPAAAGRGGSG
jgi:PAS domain S-box-containing protein